MPEMESIINGSLSLLSLGPLVGLAHSFVALPLQSVFNVVHFLLTAFALRNEPGGVRFAHLHPMASCVMTFLVANSGGILANFVLGKAPIQCVLDVRVVATCVIAWYLVFFSPLDICYGLCHFIPVNLALWVVKELARAKKAYSGVTMAAAVYPDSLLAMAVVGMLKGSGKQWGITWYRLVFNIQSASKHELLAISYVTKSAFLLSLVLAYNQVYSLLDPAPLVLLGGCAMVGVRLWNLRVRNTDPFLSPQYLAWQFLTCLCVVPPNMDSTGGRSRGESTTTTETAGPDRIHKEGSEGRQRETENTQKQGTTAKESAVEKHLKHD